MPNKWTIDGSGSKLELYCRPFLSDSQRLAQVRYLVANHGYSEQQAKVAVSLMESDPIKCDGSDIEVTTELCLHYIVSYGSSGDIILDRGTVFVILDQAAA